MSKYIIVSVTNDLSTDQRVDKTCRTLTHLGFQVMAIGRELKNSLPLDRPYKVKRMKLLFSKGPLFYAEYNLRLFLFLLAKKSDVLLANDLDTLLANHLASRVKKLELVYDSHEYFTEVPELEGRFARKVWLAIEKWIFPKLKRAYTVNKSIADIYKEKYEVSVQVVHNFPDIEGLTKNKERKDLGLPEDKRILIIQGAGLNLDRGGEEAVMSMKHISDDYYLVIIGGGDRFEAMKNLIIELQLEEKVRIESRMPYEDLMQFTFNADLGLSLDKGTSKNYIYALPNKVVDYMAAGIPVLGSDMFESRRFIEEKGIGMIIPTVDAISVAKGIEEAFSDKARYEGWCRNANEAKSSVNWKHEEMTLSKIFLPLV